MFTQDDWTADVQAWLARRTSETLRNVRAGAYRKKKDLALLGDMVEPCNRDRLKNPDVFAATVDWLAAEPGRAVTWMERDVFDTDSIKYGEPTGRWVYQKQWVLVRLKTAIEIAEENLRCPTLDAWLEALNAGKLRIDAVPEVPLDKLRGLDTEKARAIVTAARERDKRWPMECPDCGAEFRPDRYGIVRCDSCRERRRAPHPRNKPADSAQRSE